MAADGRLDEQNFIEILPTIGFVTATPLQDSMRNYYTVFLLSWLDALSWPLVLQFIFVLVAIYALVW